MRGQDAAAHTLNTGFWYIHSRLMDGHVSPFQSSEVGISEAAHGGGARSGGQGQEACRAGVTVKVTVTLENSNWRRHGIAEPARTLRHIVTADEACRFV